MQVAMKIGALTLDCNDPEKLAGFWAEVMGRDTRPAESAADRYWAVRDPDRKGPLLLLQKVPEAKTGKNRAHIDLWVADMDAEAERAVSLGATFVKKYAEPGYEGWIWMNDPEGNEFCFVQVEPKHLE